MFCQPHRVASTWSNLVKQMFFFKLFSRVNPFSHQNYQINPYTVTGEKTIIYIHKHQRNNTEDRCKGSVTHNSKAPKKEETLKKNFKQSTTHSTPKWPLRSSEKHYPNKVLLCIEVSCLTNRWHYLYETLAVVGLHLVGAYFGTSHFSSFEQLLQLVDRHDDHRVNVILVDQPNQVFLVVTAAKHRNGWKFIFQCFSSK